MINVGNIKYWIIRKYNNLCQFTENPVASLRLIFIKIPIVGPLADCQPEDHLSAATESFINIIFATMPFWISAMVGYFFSAQEDHLIDGMLFLDILKDSIKNGELLIFSTTILAPVIYLTWVDPKGSRSLPAKASVGTAVLVTMLISTSLFAALKGNSNVNKDMLIYTSAWLALIAFILSYIVVAYHKYRQGTPEQLKESEKNFVDQLRSHR